MYVYRQDENPKCDIRRIPKSAVVSPENDLVLSGRQVIFQRSISEIASSTTTSVETLDMVDGSNNRVVLRRRNNSGSIAGTDNHSHGSKSSNSRSTCSLIISPTTPISTPTIIFMDSSPIIFIIDSSPIILIDSPIIFIDSPIIFIDSPNHIY